ncbi:MAG: CDP-glucose 4,6-dehydratase [Lentisphaerae bacterium]|nr:CDP-glucose 4,6-dehydratase [Lentisphaerota bacterium]
MAHRAIVFPLANAFNGRPVFITGHTGFKGAWLSLWLHALGARVTGYALPPPTSPSHFQAAHIRRLLTRHIEADIRDARTLHSALKKTRPEIIFHLAAQALVRESFCHPRETFEINIQGLVNLLEAVRKLGRPCRVIIVTSDKCYANREHAQGYSETDPLGGYDPYSASKGAQELLVAAYRQSFFHPEQLPQHGIKLASVRSGNVIGGGDWAADRIMADCIRALIARRAIGVRNPEAVRPWQHVLEPLSGYLWLAARLAGPDAGGLCEAWNFGPSNQGLKTVQSLAEETIRCWGRGTWRHQCLKHAPHEAALLTLCCAKARRRLGWRPTWNFKTAVEQTVAWYKAWHTGEVNLQALSRDQIATYTREARRQKIQWAL